MFEEECRPGGLSEVEGIRCEFAVLLNVVGVEMSLSSSNDDLKTKNETLLRIPYAIRRTLSSTSVMFMMNWTS